MSLVSAKKFIVEVSSDASFDDVIPDFEISEKKNIVNSIEIGNFKAFIYESKTTPFHLFSNKFVKNIEEDQYASISSQQVLKIGEIDEVADRTSYYLQESPIWNLDRIDQKSNVLDDKYYYTTSGGKNVDVYIVDTGIDIFHPDFQGRAKWGGNFVDKVDTDCNSHGTHVAGSVGSMTYGVAKSTNLIAVKVLGCNGGGSYSGILAGFEYVIKSSKASKNPSVVNMSLGGGKSDAINNAVNEIIRNGIHVVVAAGNENSDSCNTSPASAVNAMTVGATTNANTLAGFSNWGKCVNILAPGTNILSTVPGNKHASLQGTSMSAPQVAGVYALFLTNNPTLSPDVMKKVLSSRCTKDAILNLRIDTINCLLYSL